MKNKFYILFFIFVLFGINGYAGIIDSLTAQKIAYHFYSGKLNELNYTVAPDVNISGSFTINSDNEPLIYIFNFDSSGFVMVSANEAIQPVLGYSLESQYFTDNIPPAFVDLMDFYKSQIQYARDYNIQPSKKISKKWDFYLSDAQFKNQHLKRSKSISPLIKTRWDQIGYFSELCPVDSNGPGNHVPAGCVATAMAQIMKYYNYPEQGSGSHSIDDWRWPGQLAANFGNTYYDYSKMPNIVNSVSTEVARLIFHCGISVDMHYFYNGSSASIRKVPTALLVYFRYRTSEYYARAEVPGNKWMTMLRDNLEQGEPVIYSGSGTDGHAFICDGYQDSTYFHFNWGWSGAYNGYFSIDSMNPGSENFVQNQSAVFNIAPIGYDYCKSEKLLEDSSLVFDDGSGANYYLKNTDCSWLISLPDTNNRIVLNFLSFSTETGKDVLSVYDGENDQSQLTGNFSGITKPGTIISSKNKLFLKFKTDSFNQDIGWVAQYYGTFRNDIPENRPAQTFSFYPNPATGFINCSFRGFNDKEVIISLLSVLGKNIYQSELFIPSGEYDKRINVPGLIKGMYILKIQSGNTVITKQVLFL